MLGIDDNLDVDSCNDTRELSEMRFLCFHLVTEHFFSKLPYKRKKIFPTQNYWSNRPILMLTFFSLTFQSWQIHLLQTIEGKENTLKRVLVAICTLDFFMIIYFNFCSDVFLFFVFSGTFFFSAAIEHIFSDHPIEIGKIFCTEKWS